MPYGAYNGPDKPNKGLENGACNRTRCQDEPATWYNHGSMAWYCESCKRDLNDAWTRRTWAREFSHYNHPQYETREMIDARKSDKT